MEKSYWRSAATSSSVAPLSADRGSIPKASIPSYTSTEASTFIDHNPYSSNNNIVLPHHGTYNMHDMGRRDVPLGTGNGFPDVKYELPSRSWEKPEAPPVPAVESNILFVDGLPTDCTRREIGYIGLLAVGHLSLFKLNSVRAPEAYLFRPFIGYRDLRVVHKEPRRRGDKAMVLCFVEFSDAKCAITAMEALQGYKFDDNKQDSALLKISFAHFPFRHPSDSDDLRH